MMRQSEFKKKYDPDTGKFLRKHIYGEGIMDTIKSFISKKPTRKKVKFTPPPIPTPTTTKKAGDKIMQMLSAKNLPSRSKQPVTKKSGDKIVKMLSGKNPAPRKMTQQEINNRVLQIMTGAGKKK